MRKRIISFLFLLTFLPSINAFAGIPNGNGTWAYDTLYNSNGKKIGNKPGLFAGKIEEYNNSAKDGHKINQIFSYGGDMEMYCAGSGESKPDEVCTDSKMFVYHDLETTKKYYELAANAPISIVPIVDGRLDQKGENDLLSALNNLDEPTAQLYADKVAALYCKDDRIAGVQFDIEPFGMDPKTQKGQEYFYRQIAKDFAGKNNPRRDGSDPLNCVNASHPEGRFFSVFTFAKDVNETVAHVLNSYGNGFIVDSLYDLGTKEGGKANSEKEYAGYVDQEVKDMLEKANKLNVKFQFAIAAAASAHEFESKAGVKTGYLQINYVKAAFAAIENNKAKADPHFLGINVWSFNDRMYWNGDEYTPAIPNGDVSAFLGNNL